MCVVAMPLHDLAKHMFNNLTTIYAAYFRNENPLAYEWNTTEVREELGHDHDILDSFQKIKVAIMQFCRCLRLLSVGRVGTK